MSGFQKPSTLNSWEQRIVDAWESGKKAPEIAAEMGCKESSVRRIAGMFTSDHQRRFERETARSSALLLAAIAKHHPEMVA